MRSMAFAELKTFVARWRKELVGLAMLDGLVGLVSAVLFVLWWFGRVTFVEQEVTIVQIITALFVLVGMHWTMRRVRAAEKTVEVVEEGHITDRFTKAIAQLGDDKMAIRLGGIYALERIAKDSEKDHGPIMEVLTADVREKAPRKENHKPQADEKPPTDIQAILTVIRRRETTDKNRGTDRLDLRKTHLVGAGLIEANLTGIILLEADLRGAYLMKADLTGAILTGAILTGADLDEAILTGADLRGADLTEAKHLTEEQVRSARSCYRATLPDYLPDSVKDLTKRPPPD